MTTARVPSEAPRAGHQSSGERARSDWRHVNMDIIMVDLTQEEPLMSETGEAERRYLVLVVGMLAGPGPGRRFYDYRTHNLRASMLSSRRRDLITD
jgi:hypothetical protein